MASTRSTIVVANIHCPSCVTSITDILRSFRPRPSPHDEGLSNIDVSLLTGIVAFSATSPLPSSTLDRIVDELTSAGFEVVSASSDVSSADATPGSSALERPSTVSHDRAWWARLLESPKERRAREAHEARCSACQAAKARSSERSLLSTLLGRKDNVERPSSPEPFPSATPEDKGHEIETKLAIEGMTCSSCVQALEHALSPSSLPGVRAVVVTLIPAVATVRHAGIVSTGELIEAVEGAGYDASLVSSSTLSPALSQVVSPASGRKIKAVLAIGGMTCASCVGSVRSAVTPTTIPGLLSFEVDLIGGRGSVETTDRAVIEKVRQEIADVGFDCEVAEVEDVDAGLSRDASSAPMRTARVRLVGMYCPDCTAKVTDVLNSLHRSHGLVFTPFDHSAPVTTLRYVPSPPSFTLRDVKRAVESSGFGFTVADEETSVEARAKLAQRRERVRILVRLGITLLFAIPAFIINVVGMSLLSSTNPFRRYWEHPIWGGASRGTVAMWVLATPVEFGVGWFFFSRAWKSLRGVWRKPRPGQSKGKVWLGRLFKWGSMDTLVALGTAVAYFASVAFMVLDITAGADDASEDMGYFDTPIFLMFFILCGRYLEARARASTGDAIDDLHKMKPSRGTLLITDEATKESRTEDVDASLIEVGDVLIVPVGSSPPLDASLVPTSSSTNFDESTLTGESRPVAKVPDDEIYSGTVNVGPAACVVRVAKPQGSTMLDGIVGVVRHAMGRKAGVERVADKVTGYFVPAVVGVATIAFVVWIMCGYLGALPPDWNDRGGWVLFAIQFGVSALVVACPCGIGLAAPTAQMVGMGLAARNGILPHGGGEAFESADNTKFVVLDKTGTLTLGTFTVTDELFTSLSTFDPASVYAAVNAVEQSSTHPISLGMQTYCLERAKSTPAELVSSEEIPGRGLVGVVARSNADRWTVLVGNEKLLEDHHARAPTADVRDSVEMWQRQGKSIVYVAISAPSSSDAPVLAAVFAVQDPPRPESPLVVEELRKAGVEVWMITGDNLVTAKAVAVTVGIPEERIVAGALPADKRDAVERLQRTAVPRKRWFGSNKGKGSKRPGVMFCGDGINDAPAIAQADVGVALGSGSAIAQNTAGFVVLADSIVPLLTVLKLSKATIRKIKTNFGWALVYNVILIPLAAGAFYPAGRTRLPPVWSSVAMAMSSLSVVGNSLLLRWTFKPPRPV